MTGVVKLYSGRVMSRQGSGQPVERQASANPIERAREEARSIVADAHAEAEAVRAQARSHLEDEFRDALARRLTAAALAFESRYHDSAGALAEILENALRQLVGRTAGYDQTMIAARAAIAKYGEDRALTVIVSPHDYSRLKLLAVEAAEDQSTSTINVVVDESMNRGECILDTGAQRFEVGVEAQIRAFRQMTHNAASAIVREQNAR